MWQLITVCALWVFEGSNVTCVFNLIHEALPSPVPSPLAPKCRFAYLSYPCFSGVSLRYHLCSSITSATMMPLSLVLGNLAGHLPLPTYMPALHLTSKFSHQDREDRDYNYSLLDQILGSSQHCRGLVSLDSLSETPVVHKLNHIMDFSVVNHFPMLHILLLMAISAHTFLWMTGLRQGDGASK